MTSVKEKKPQKLLPGLFGVKPTNLEDRVLFRGPRVEVEAPLLVQVGEFVVGTTTVMDTYARALGVIF